MTKRIKLLTGLVIISLLSILGLQAYFIKSDFQTKSIEFEQDVNEVVNLAILEMEEIRKQTIRDLIVKDFENPDIARFEYGQDAEGNTKVKIYDAQTNDVRLEYTFSREIPEDSLSTNHMVNKMFGSVGADASSYLYISVISSLDNRFESYQDSISIDVDILDEKLNQKFLARSIDAPYEMVVLHKDSAFTVEHKWAIASIRRDISLSEDDNEIIILFNNPFYDILKRSAQFLVSSAGVIMLVLISFIMLMRTINRQRKLSEVKDDFIDGVTHELLTPISTMNIALESMDKGVVMDNKTKAKKYLGIARQELLRISNIVQNVLISNVHDRKETQLKPEELDLNKIIQDLIVYHQNRLDETVLFSFVEAEDANIFTNRQHLINVFHNLFDNAIKHCVITPEIEVKIRSEGQKLKVIIRDNAVGIPNGQKEKIFKKFYRVEQRDFAQSKGLGVGLYYVKSILDEMNGEIELLDSSIKGSTFVVTLFKTTNAA